MMHDAIWFAAGSVAAFLVLALAGWSARKPLPQARVSSFMRATGELSVKTRDGQRR